MSSSADVYKRAEGDFKNLFCGVRNHDYSWMTTDYDDFIWNNCRWVRWSDNSSCNFTQTRNETTEHFEIDQNCKRDFSNVQFIGSRNQDSRYGDHLCGIHIRNLRSSDSGVWECNLDYIEKFNCTAEGSVWLTVFI